MPLCKVADTTLCYQKDDMYHSVPWFLVNPFSIPVKLAFCFLCVVIYDKKLYYYIFVMSVHLLSIKLNFLYSCFAWAGILVQFDLNNNFVIS